MEKLPRRSLLRITAAVPAVIAVPSVACAATPDPIVALYAERQRLEQIAMTAADMKDEEWSKLPEWAKADDPLYARGKHVPEVKRMGGWPGAARGGVLSLQVIRKYNLHTESLVNPNDPIWHDLGPSTDEDWTEWRQRRAEGRARMRWWIAERRAMDAARTAYDRAWQANDAAWDALWDIERRICETEATTLQGVRLKLMVASASWRDDRSAAETTLEIEDRLVCSALRDLEGFTA